MTGTSSAARSSSRRCGRGRPRAAASSSISSSASAPRATGAASASPWTRALSQGASSRCSSSFHTQATGLIYKDKRLVNWDPKFQTAHLRPRGRDGRGQGQPLALQVSAEGRSPRAFIVVATTRPETMLGDTAVAVHPDDRALQGPDRQDGRAAAGRARDSDHRRRIRRSRRRAPARSRSRRRTTSTTTRSTSATPRSA